MTMETPQLLDVEQVSDGWIKKYILTYKMPDGTEVKYESVSRKDLEGYTEQLHNLAEGKRSVPDAVCIVPILPDDSLLLIKEFRFPLNAWCVAFPAGLIEPGEDLESAIDRELREETGYGLRRDIEKSPIILLPQSGFSSTGLGEESVQVVLAYVDKVGEPRPEDTELIETFVLKRENVAEFLETNTLPIGTRCQLLLETSKRVHVLRKRLKLARHPITSDDYA